MKSNISKKAHKINRKWLRTLVLTAALAVLVSHCDKTSPVQIEDPPPPTEHKPEVLATYPHDPGSFTQGLLFSDNFLYEGSGRYGLSSFRKVVPQTGEVVYSDTLSRSYFGEGLALKGGRFVQLTWLSGVAYIYDSATLAKVDTFRYQGEGWGLTADSQNFIMSDGSDKLYFRDDNFKVVRTLNVRQNGNPVYRLNELEYANGLVYANVWRMNYVLEISPQTGVVQRVIDCQELFDIEQPVDPEYVLNGIAYDANNGSFYLTGKNWHRMFVVQF